MARQIGSRIRALRILRNLSQRELAKDLGITQTRLHRIETGTTKIGAEELQGIARFFDRPIEDFFRQDFTINVSNPL